MKQLKTLSLIIMLSFSTLIVNAQKHKSTNNIDTLINAYLAIKNALIANDGTKAHYKAQELYNVLATNPDKGLSLNQKKIMRHYIGDLIEDSSLISDGIREDAQREHFANLSKNMFDFLKALKMNNRIIYEQYCPMKKAYWLSETSKIKNPYYNFNSEMSTCGKTTATLAAIR